LRPDSGHIGEIGGCLCQAAASLRVCAGCCVALPAPCLRGVDTGLTACGPGPAARAPGVAVAESGQRWRQVSVNCVPLCDNEDGTAASLAPSYSLNSVIFQWLFAAKDPRCPAASVMALLRNVTLP
jgi:hypothetical protein